MRRRCTNSSCVHGPEPLPWAYFHAAVKWPDGTMRRPQSRCKDCMLAANRARNTTSKGRRKRNARRRREYRAMRRDPERVAVDQTRKREWLRQKRGIAPESYRYAPDEGQTVPSAVVQAAIKASGESLAVVAAWAAVPESSTRKILKRDEIPVQLATAILDAIGVWPADLGL